MAFASATPGPNRKGRGRVQRAGTRRVSRAQNTKCRTLFAISGIRLGAWMPNPKFLTIRRPEAAVGGSNPVCPGCAG